MNTYILLTVGFLTALILASTFSLHMLRRYSKDDLEEFLRDIKVCELNPYTSIVKAYRLPNLVLQDGKIILLRSIRWQILYPQSNNTIYAPIKSNLVLGGFVRLNLTSVYISNKIYVLVNKV